VFELTALDTGDITRIQIGHDNSGPGAGWYCEDVKIKKFLNRENVVEFLKTLKKSKSKSKDKHKKRPSSAKLMKERQLSDIQEDEEEEESDDENDEEKKKAYKNVFDKEGRVVKVPVHEEYYFVCKNWLATDEADGLTERELEVKKKAIFYQDRDWQ